jgi:enoyl-CoA hydratase/carnithine racemase
VFSRLADHVVDSAALTAVWDALPSLADVSKASIDQLIATKSIAAHANFQRAVSQNVIKIDAIFSLNTVKEIMAALEHDASPWALETAAILRKRSPLILHVVLEQIRRARSMGLADDLRMERDMVRHCFHTHHLQRTGAATETMEGIRALAVDKDHTPRWNPARIEDVTADMVEPFFTSPWPAHAHPLRNLKQVSA